MHLKKTLIYSPTCSNIAHPDQNNTVEQINTCLLCSSSSCSLTCSCRTITCRFHSAMGQPASSWVGTRESMSARITSTMGTSSNSSSLSSFCQRSTHDSQSVTAKQLLLFKALLHQLHYQNPWIYFKHLHQCFQHCNCKMSRGLYYYQSCDDPVGLSLLWISQHTRWSACTCPSYLRSFSWAFVLKKGSWSCCFFFILYRVYFYLYSQPAHRLSGEDCSESGVPQGLHRLHVGHEGEVPLWRLQMVEWCHNCNKGKRSNIQF